VFVDESEEREAMEEKTIPSEKTSVKRLHLKR